MELDSIDNQGQKEISYLSKENYRSTKSKYCHICNKPGHTTSECRHNNFTNRCKNNNTNKNSQKVKNDSRRGKHSKSYHNRNNKNNKYISNVEYEEPKSEEELSFEDLKAMYGKNMDSIEIINEHQNIERTNNNVNHQFLISQIILIIM